MRRTVPVLADVSPLASSRTPQTRTDAVPVDEPRPSLLDDDRGRRVVLPNEHPEWRRDVVSLSERAKAALGRVQMKLIRVVTFWDHRTTSLALEDRTLEVDYSGSYRAV